MLLLIAWWAFLLGSPGAIVGFVVYRWSPALDIEGVREWTTLPRFLVLNIILTFGYGLCASIGFLVELPSSSNPFLGVVLAGYVYVACLLEVAAVGGVVDRPTPRAWFGIVGGIGTLLPVLSIVLMVAVNYW